MTCRVSVIIPIHNSERTLGRCLSAVSRLDPPPAEVILVDDGSRDDSAAIARASGFPLYRFANNQGRAAAKDFGMRHATGDILFFVDSDVVLEKGCLGAIGRHFEDPTLTGLCGVPDPDAGYPGFPSRFKAKYMYFIMKQCVGLVTFSYGSAQAFRAAHLTAAERVMLFGRGLISHICDDTELGLRLTESGRRIRLADDVRYVHERRFTWAGILANDFRVPFAFALLASERGRWLQGIRSGSFVHTSLAQVAAVILSALAVTLAGLSVFDFRTGLAALVCFSATLILQRRFLRFASRGESAWTAAGLAVFNVFDQVVMMAGMTAGFTVAASRRVTQAREIPRARTLNAESLINEPLP